MTRVLPLKILSIVCLLIGVTAIGPPPNAATTPSNLPPVLDVLVKTLKDNPAFVQKFMPLFDALKPYVSSAGSSSNPAAAGLRYKFWSSLLVDLPKVLNSTLFHQVFDSVSNQLGQVNFTGVDQSNSSQVIQAVIGRFSWDGLLNDLYVIAEKGHVLPSKPTFQTTVEELVLNFTLGSLPKFLKNPLLWITKDLLLEEVKAVNLTGVKSSAIIPVLEKIYLEANWDRFLQKFYSSLRIFIPSSPSLQYTIKSSLMNFTLHTVPLILKNPLFRALDYIFMKQFHKMDFKGTDFRNPGEVVKAFLLQLHPEEIIKQINRLPGMESPEAKAIEITDVCVDSIAWMYQSIIKGDSWAINMVDAIGKPGAGILKGNLYMTGNYEECVAVRSNDGEAKFKTVDSHSFSGQYCRITVELPKSFVDGLGVDTHGIPVRLSWGLCVPDVCSDTDIRGTFTAGFMSRLNLSITDVFCGNDLDLSQDGSAIAAIVILSILLALTAIGTTVEIVTERKHSTDTTGQVDFPLKSIPNGTNGHINGGFVSEDHKIVTSLSENVNGLCNSKDEKLYVVENDTVVSDVNKKAVTSELDVSKKPLTSELDVKHNRQEPTYIKLCKSFSLMSNVPKVLAATHPKGSITCLNGIRYLSMAWVILCHTFYYGVFSISDNQTTENMIDAPKFIQRLSFMAVAYGTFSVDTFFLLSGLLVAYLFFKDIDRKKGKVTCLKMVIFYIHRFWRLTPIYMIVIMMFTGLHKYVIFGPMLPRDMSNAENCKTNWWTNLLYINNLVNVDDMCMGWTWYLANDMQFYIISPIFILALYFFPVVGVILTSLLVAASIVSSAVIENKGAGNMLSIKEANGDHPNYYNDIYIKPWCRIGAYAIGLLLARVMYRKKKQRMSLPVAAIGWIIALSVGLFVTYCGYTEQKLGGVKWSQPIRTAYESLSRPVFAACVAWVIYACHTERGGYINSILSWKGLIPMARLTYAAYLIHPIIMFMYMYRRHTLIYLNDYTMVYFYLGHLCLAYGAAFVLSVLFESPFLGLEKILLKMIGS